MRVTIKATADYTAIALARLAEPIKQARATLAAIGDPQAEDRAAVQWFPLGLQGGLAASLLERGKARELFPEHDPPEAPLLFVLAVQLDRLADRLEYLEREGERGSVDWWALAFFAMRAAAALGADGHARLRGAEGTRAAAAARWADERAEWAAMLAEFDERKGEWKTYAEAGRALAKNFGIFAERIAARLKTERAGTYSHAPGRPRKTP